MEDLHLAQGGDRSLDGAGVLLDLVAGVEETPDAIDLRALGGAKDASFHLQTGNRVPKQLDVDGR